MGESFSKKEIAKKRAKDKQEKAAKMKDRKENNNKGKSLESMMAYIDENGNITDTPPDTSNKQEINLEDIVLGAAPIIEESATRKGVVSFFNEAKNYGFITDDKTKENVFFHGNQVSEPLKERDRVSFEKEKTPKGFSAINVSKIK